MRRRIVITGLGMVTPVGNNVKDSWENILNGQSGIAIVDEFNTEEFPSRIGGRIRDLDLSPYMSPKEARKMDPFIHYGLAASIQAIEDAGLVITEENAERVGIAIGSGIGGLRGFEKGYSAYLDGGPRKVSPFLVPSIIINMVGGNLSIRYGIKGPNYAISTACSTGLHNIGDAARMIERGDVDVMIAGGAEMGTCPTDFCGFAAARALSTRNDEPEKASRPWDKDRDGFILSDGAGVVVLEALDTAKARGAEIYAEVAGFAMNADAHHITLPPDNAEGAKRCIELCLKDAGMNPEDIDYINAHGTSTPAGDVAETRAIKRAFGDHAYKLAISSTKSMVGHMLGAAGSVEVIYNVLALRDQVAPPTINLDEPSEECDLDYVPKTARELKIDANLSNSFGFGGTNGTMILKRM
ncbi:MAG: 3-oxoacyl-[acyl-carrier-protein] synthase II [Candidatus Kentron sp. G]|nr:MAG: 3-oxoacyl-[acyl-carrier-protein] synthase II [Candidatus Kentron sp. G]VFN01449.1 MAG: 3-oxoacyl-[acyl-carrier-protein] synthase II [Candidatus Kentron sp. G]VFN02962.1 MAG: 3-oxoacyl-[acyl-carrier-protein] synthase II [Candidatus Kentron sp. G]